MTVIPRKNTAVIPACFKRESPSKFTIPLNKKVRLLTTTFAIKISKFRIKIILKINFASHNYKGINLNELKKGYIQVYTGNGKGKTTAAIGQAVRAAGFGLKIYFAQFMKDFPYSELVSLKHLESKIVVEQFGNDSFVFAKEPPSKLMIDSVKVGLEKSKERMLSGEFDLIILDEICVSIYFKLFSIDDILQFLEVKPKNIEIILTGRYCPKEIIEKADLVTEMKNIKHYYDSGITVRKGIES